MKKILIYGDSNVWGDNFITRKRIPDDKQWTNILQKEFKDKYLFIQEGLPGRVAGNEIKDKKFKNGKDSFMAILKTAAPVDKVIIALGTNDLQVKYHNSAKKIINYLLWYTKVIEENYLDEDDRKKYFVDGKMPEIIYILPINFSYSDSEFSVFNLESESNRQKIIKYFEKNKINNIVLNNASLFEDGLHLDYKGHKQMADKVKEYLEHE